MTHHSDTEIGELAEYLVRCCEQSYGASALVMLPAGSVRKAASALQSLLADKARMEKEIAFIWKWVERGLFDTRTVTPTEALNVLAHYPAAPWKNGRWDVDHKSYAAVFYKAFPKAAALSTITPKEAE